MWKDAYVARGDAYVVWQRESRAARIKFPGVRADDFEKISAYTSASHGAYKKAKTVERVALLKLNKMKRTLYDINSSVAEGHEPTDAEFLFRYCFDVNVKRSKPQPKGEQQHEHA